MYGWLPGNFWFPNLFVQRHLVATDCSISTDCAELTALICLEPLLAWIVSDSLCPKLVNWSSSARIAFLRQTRLRTETICFTWCTDIQRDKDRQTDRQTRTNIQRQTKTDTQTDMHIQTNLVDRQRDNKIKTQTDRHWQNDTNRQIIVSFYVLQPQTVCRNLDCLQAWLERIELIWSPASQTNSVGLATAQTCLASLLPLLPHGCGELQSCS